MKILDLVTILLMNSTPNSLPMPSLHDYNLVNERIRQLDGKGIMTCIERKYDFDRNGVVDATAIYPAKLLQYNLKDDEPFIKVVYSDVPQYIYWDEDGDGNIDFLYIDSDGDGMINKTRDFEKKDRT